jgi:transposase InsO family protein
MSRPRVLIEQWLPIAEIGAECMRERGASSALPPLYFLHVWWARRPLTVIYLKDYERVDDLYNGLEAYFQFYNQERRHQALDYRTPSEVYQASLDLSL